jgi:RNA polymerase sigma factor (sigma-70 family)
VARRTSVDDVQDVVAETFLTAWRRLDAIPDDPVPWLFVTARNVLANKDRTRRRQQVLGTKLASVARWDAPLPLDDGTLDHVLVAAIKNLPEREREAFMLVAWDGLDGDRAAQAAGCRPGTFRMRLLRARKRLKKELASSSYALTDVTPALEDRR